MSDVFTRPARDLKDEPARGQLAPQHVEDGFPIAGGRRRIKAGVFFHAPLVRIREPINRSDTYQRLPKPAPNSLAISNRF